MDMKTQEALPDNSGEEDKYATAKRERQKYVDAILRSTARKKIVVGGPGTGKTYLFKIILEGKKNTLTLTFVNALVDDLSLELCGISDVKTLHGFARGVLKKAVETKGAPDNIKIYRKLAEVIKEDAIILLNEEIDFDHLFHNRDDENKHIEFYKKRKNYYAHYGFTDIVFGAVKYLEANKHKIPTFTQVVVDEFQDFNELEVSLIDLLAEKSPVLLVGDDDQALYESLKSASPRHIRQRHSEKNCGYVAFTLPYCSRSTRVIVDAINDIIEGATRVGNFTSRIPKPFRYFDDEEKDKDSDDNPRIIYMQRFETQIPAFIERRIEEIAKEVRDEFTVLIISPSRRKSLRIVEALRGKGFKNVQFKGTKDTVEPTLLDGLMLLLENNECNLGWRIVARRLLDDTEFTTLLKKTDDGDARGFSDLIEDRQKRVVNQMLTTLRAIKGGKQKDDDKLAELLEKVGLDAYGMARDFLKNEVRSGLPPDANRGISKTLITATTVQSSKGLSADYVFITHFDDRYFIKDRDKSRVSDQDICNVLVAFTRARKKVFLISSDAAKRPVFLNWISAKHIRQVKETNEPYE